MPVVFTTSLNEPVKLKPTPFSGLLAPAAKVSDRSPAIPAAVMINAPLAFIFSSVLPRTFAVNAALTLTANPSELTTRYILPESVNPSVAAPNVSAPLA